ncbi:MAG: hypothetical protein IT435_01030 [Phycisphaerales bacterium]|nr:hypothetical protein [Phycisphaerales bacterium]
MARASLRTSFCVPSARAFAAILILFACGAAPAALGGGIHFQPADPPAPEKADPQELSPGEVWQRVTAAYRAAPFAERIRIGIVKPKPLPAPDEPSQPDADRLALEDFLRASSGMDEQRGVLFLRVAPLTPTTPTTPTAPAPTADPQAPISTCLRLEMGDLRIFGEPGRLLAVRASVPGGVVMRTFDGPLTIGELERLMPPLMLPQLAIAIGDVANRDRFLPGLPAVSWLTSQRAKEGSHPVLLLRGTAGDGSSQRNIEAAIDESTFRIARLKVGSTNADEPTDGSAATSLELFITPIEPGDPASWRIETEGRIAVTTLAELRSAPPVAPPPPNISIKAGDALPQFYLFNAQTETWANEESPAGRFAGVVPEDGQFRIALVVFVPVGDGPQGRELHESLARVREMIHEAIGDEAASVGMYAAGVALGELDRFDDSRRRAMRDWSLSDPLNSAPGSRSIPLLCSPAGAGLLSRLGGKGPVIVVTDQTLTVRDVIELPAAADAAAAGQRLRAAIRAGS